MLLEAFASDVFALIRVKNLRLNVEERVTALLAEYSTSDSADEWKEIPEICLTEIAQRFLRVLPIRDDAVFKTIRLDEGNRYFRSSTSLSEWANNGVFTL